MQSPFTEEPIKDDTKEIFLSPNPFKLSSDKLLSIWNFFPGSKVRIMTLNGTPLKTFRLNKNENKIYSWDGMMDNGKKISSGIYLVTSYHPKYGSRVGKLAIIK